MLDRRQFLAAAALAPALPALGTPPGAPGEASGEFAWRLYRQFAAEPKGVFLSPFSVRVALAMTAAGAGGDTLGELQSALGLDRDPAATDARFAKLLAAVQGDTGPQRAYELSTANRLWVQSGAPPKPAFVARAQAGYRADAAECDFRAAPEPSRATINAWVAGRTRGKIQDLLPAGSVTSDTKLVLTNAVYFKGLWAAPFDKSLTKDEPFLLPDGGKKPLPLLRTSAGVLATDAADRPYQSAELFYRGGEVSLLVVVPRDPGGLAAVEALLSPATLRDLHAGDASGPNTLVLPRFKLEFEAELTKTLQTLGVRRAFTAGADFSGLSDAGRLAIGGVFHKAFVEVDEQGTEAAAATGVLMAPTSMPAPRPVKPPIVVRADRPFLFALRHAPTGELLFVGRYVG